MEQPVPGSAVHIDDIATRLEAAFNASDAAAVASLYSDTAILMPPNESMVRGRAEIQAWFERALQRLRGIRVVPVESTAAGDQAYQVGSFTTRAKTDAAASFEDERSAAQTGKYALLLKKSAGGWKIQYDIWNLDADG